MKLVRMEDPAAERLLARLERRSASNTERVMPAVERIVGDVRRQGERALRRYARQLDGLGARQPLGVGREEMEEAWRAISPSLRSALRSAAKNIRGFAQRQMPKEWTAGSGGLSTGQRVRPLEAVGCYVPGGRYPLPSTLLMTVIPAQVARVERIVVVSPKPARETLAAAALLGVEHFYRIGGAQAIAALAYGVAGLPPVAKIVGPGNWYVTAAKRLVAFDCAIDMLAGPTEIVVVSQSGDPAGIAADLVAQAEHDPQALAIFVTTKVSLARAVEAQVRERIRSNAVARQSLEKNGLILLARSTKEARDIANRLAPEHLTVDAMGDLAWVRNAGSVFVGRESAQAMGDYVSGPNHTLPTGGAARARGGLSVLDFVKLVTVQRYTNAGIKRLGPAAIALAQAEGLAGHAAAVRARGIEARGIDAPKIGEKGIEARGSDA